MENNNNEPKRLISRKIKGEEGDKREEKRKQGK